MIKLVFSTDEKFKFNLGRWVTERTFMVRRLKPGDYEIIGVISVDPQNQKSEVIAGCLFHDYCALGDGGKVEVSMAAESPRWARAGIIRAILHYPFVQLNCHVLICTTNKTNRRTRKFLTGLGFKERGVVPNRPFADDTVIYALRREDAARWLDAKETRKAA